MQHSRNPRSLQARTGIETRAKKTVKKYANSRLNHPLLTKEYEAYMKQKSLTTNLNVNQIKSCKEDKNWKEGS